MSAQDIAAKLIAERAATHGPFLRNAATAQGIKAAFRSDGARWESLPADVREALDLIATKIARVITGGAEYLDHWDDIGGYSRLVADRVRKSAEQP